MSKANMSKPYIFAVESGRMAFRDVYGLSGG